MITSKSSSRNDESVIHENQAVPLRINYDVALYLSRKYPPDVVQLFRPLAVLGILNGFQDNRIFRPVGQRCIFQFILPGKILLDERCYLSAIWLVVGSFHQSAEAKAKSSYIIILAPTISIQQTSPCCVKFIQFEDSRESYTMEKYNGILSFNFMIFSYKM